MSTLPSNGSRVLAALAEQTKRAVGEASIGAAIADRTEREEDISPAVPSVG